MTAVVVATVLVVVVVMILVWAGAVIDIVVEVLTFAVQRAILLDEVKIILAEVVVDVLIDFSADLKIGIALGIGVEVFAGVDVNVCAAAVTASPGFLIATTLEQFSTCTTCDCWPLDFFNCERALQDCMPWYHVW